MENTLYGKFFSFVTQPSESLSVYFFDWKQRLQMKHAGADNHLRICNYYGLDEGDCNKWIYYPLTKDLRLDEQNDLIDDTEVVKWWVDNLDWGNIIEPLIIKPIVNPFKLPAVETVTDEQIGWLKELAKIMGHFGQFEWFSLHKLVGQNVVDLIWDSVWWLLESDSDHSIFKLVRHNVPNSDTELVYAIDDSVSFLFRAYVGSFFKTESVLRVTPAIKLWEAGLVPSFDDTTWRLHTGVDARIVYEWKPEEFGVLIAEVASGEVGL